MSFLYDILTILIFVLFIIFGYRKGFIRSLLNFIASLAIIVISLFSSVFLSNAIFDSFIKPSLYTTIMTGISSTTGSYIANIQDVINQINNFFAPITAILGSNWTQTSGITNTLTDFGNSTVNFAIDTIKPIVVGFMSALIFIIISILLSIIVKALFRVLYRTFSSKKKSKDGCKFIDGVFGGVFGFAKGFIIICVIAFIIYLLINFANVNNNIVSREIINSTYLFKYFCYFVPLECFAFIF